MVSENFMQPNLVISLKILKIWGGGLSSPNPTETSPMQAKAPVTLAIFLINMFLIKRFDQIIELLNVSRKHLVKKTASCSCFILLKYCIVFHWLFYNPWKPNRWLNQNFVLIESGPFWMAYFYYTVQLTWKLI